MTTPFWRRLPLLLASLLGFVLLITMVWAENIAASRSALVALLVFMPQQGFGLPPLLFGLISVVKRHWRCALINAVTLWLWAQWLLGWNVPLRRLMPWPNAPATLRVMTLNVQRGERGVPGLKQIIDAAQPDILCLQETQDPPPRHFTFPGDVFETSWTGWHFARGGDVMTLSHFPLVSKRLWPLSGPLSSGRRVLETVWQTPQGRVRVLNVHIAKSDAEGALQHRDAAFALQLGANAQIAAQTRLEQWPALQSAIAGEKTLPLIVAGDFNSPARGEFYRGLAATLSDAWAQGGWGTGATFPSRWPLLGIDHIFLRGAHATRAWVPRSNASDHLPLVADVRLDDQ